MKILSQETIKPSSPTPSHLKTHVLSLVDNISPHLHMKYVFFYKNYNNGDTNILKKSLSQCLTLYYPFAGRFNKPSTGEIDCNDAGVEFTEVVHDNHFNDFIVNTDNVENRLDVLVSNVSFTSPTLVEVQLNHFSTSGGVAIGLSISHKVADGFTTFTFMKQWAAIARGQPPFKPKFYSSGTKYNNALALALSPDEGYKCTHEVKHVTRTFVFPNTKLNELKKKVICFGYKPTRVELLTSLLFKSSVTAARAKSKALSFNPSTLSLSVNMREKIFDQTDYERTAGNILVAVVETMGESEEITVSNVVARIRKRKMGIEERDFESIGEKLANIFAKLGDVPVAELYWFSSLCWFPVYETDFGWGKPVDVKPVLMNTERKLFVLQDTPIGDGIEVTIRLPEEEMIMVQHDEEVLAFVDG